MLEYEWGNPSAAMLSGEETLQEQDQTRQIFDHYTAPSMNEHLLQQPTTGFFHHHPTTTTTTPHQVNTGTLYDQRTYSAPNHSLLSLDPVHTAATGPTPATYFFVPKTEDVCRAEDYSARIGLNLGGRTYFSSTEDDFVNRLYRRSRPHEPGSSNVPRCQAEGCNVDLTHAKHYHRRHKVCEFHSKASTVIVAGLTQRFCQQCSRFHLLPEFDNGKRSCRRRLADHNRRRRKSHQTNQENHKSQLENARNCSTENVSRSPQDSGPHSSSSVTVAISPPRMSLDCFKQRPYQVTASSSASSSSLFFSSG
ncbi:hypothetical protein K2173_024974 [Erythroxylum novogranatense]|uniref:SBP-type domain-containing protein n=1 Tax=Erythroxylum novogranatense TaxID=1862640 RepID=A0AAV8UCV8_9ROSI|nr:hypothetical protein K2173_024974 [Erythroxylum novogranatense]